MSIKIFVIGDPHFKISNIEETNEMCVKILQKINELQPHAVVCLGDILDRHETIHVGPLLRSIQFFQKIASKYPLYLLIGNHDRPSNQVFLTDEHPFTALKQWKNTVVVDKVYVERIQNQDFLFVPYVPNGRFMEAISLCLGENPDLSVFPCIFAHQEFKGAKMGATVSLMGDEWNEEYPLVISGHIHDFDKLGKNIIYTGTPIQHSYGDKDDKGVFLFHFDYKGYKYEKFDLGLPKKKIVKICASEVESLKKLDPRSHYKIIISGTPDELKMVKIGPFLENLPKSKIAYKTISTLTDKLFRECFDQKPFLEILRQEINKVHEHQERNELIKMYTELFQ